MKAVTISHNVHINFRGSFHRVVDDSVQQHFHHNEPVEG